MEDRVYWDGCARRLLDDNGDALTHYSFRGEMKGLSLQVQLFNDQHSLVFQNIGGVEFPFELVVKYSEKIFEWKQKLVFEDDDIDEGIRIAFHPLIHYDKFPEKPIFYEE